MARFTPHTEQDVRQMLDTIGVDSVEKLFADIPKELRPRSFDLPEGMSENETVKFLTALSRRNRTDYVSFLGGGYYDHFIPAAVNAISSRSEFYTAYTPYQPEASQGTLRAIFEYQTMISGITGLDYANASLYDGGTALYEAVAMAVRSNNRRKIIIDRGVNPLYRRIVATYVINIDVDIVEVDLRDIYPDMEKIRSLLDEHTAALVVQNPNFFGLVDDYADLFARARECGAVSILVFYPVSLGILKTPGEMKADIAVAEGQSLGLPLSFGGPYLGIMAVEKEFVRKMPGRIVGETLDRSGRKSFVLTLQAREQHIRREKATSNICSNQALCALRAVAYLSLLGRDGYRKTALINLERAEYLKNALRKIRGIDVREGQTFNEFTVAIPVPAGDLVAKLLARGYAAGLTASLFYPVMKNCLILAVTEKRSHREMDAFAEAVREALT
ncbi:MAG: glycine dehydrogenase (aminomethyl-transferring) [Spirochaetes bacterium RBG_13_51_14]|nr:MAG: glycine dehydrogenase (aminomethyl-transferring) [Spirochaetes bacterium RBG_13_51_14]